jgi:CRP-like cAMP-binding protein
MNDVSSHLFTGNRLLAALPDDELAKLRPHLEPISLKIGTVLANNGDEVTHCYFPTKGMISLLSVTERGETIEVAYTGREGMAGLAAVLNGDEALYQMLVQATTDCYVAEARVISRLFQSEPVFHNLLLRYVYALLKQMSQTCVCNHFHTIEQRLCRWLTVMTERSENRRLTLTQEFLSHMLGVQRTSIGLVANTMQTKGIIRYSRGKIDVIDLDRLRQNSCECYRVVNAEYDSLYKHNGHII